MNILDEMLRQKLKQSRAKKARNKPLTHVQKIERVTAGMIGREFLIDLTKLLDNSLARLGLVWKGKAVALFIQQGDRDPEVFVTLEPHSRVSVQHPGGPLCERLRRLLKIHKTSILVHWHGGEPYVQILANEVGDRFALNIIKGRKGFKIFFDPDNL